MTPGQAAMRERFSNEADTPPGLLFLHSDEQLLLRVPLDKDKEEKEMVLLVLVVVEKGQWQKRKGKKCGEGWEVGPEPKGERSRCQTRQDLPSKQTKGRRDNAARVRHAMLV